MVKKDEGPLEMHDVIVNAILNGANFPLKLNDDEKKKFADEIAKVCDLHSFIKTRENFRKDVGKVIDRYVSGQN
ncbi:MAG: hypothetical protein CMA28_04530 [Euryarchaeota archaeon]|nr:hypothetical protein [Euryarchaeota archaeon]|tara:strand:+ start:140 stop:361 length:222 start_codon:yes stop_codon:yes gene_type:complete